MADDQKTEHRQHLEDKPPENQRHATQQNQRRDRAGDGAARSPPVRRAPRRFRPPAGRHSAPGGSAPGWDAARQRRIAHSIARPATSTSARRQAASSRTPRAHGSVEVIFSQFHSMRHAADSPERVHHLARHVGQETRGAHQHLRPQAVRHQRSRQFTGRLGCWGRRGSGGGLGGSLGQCSGDRLQGRCDLGALLRILQHLQRPARIVRTDLGRTGLRGRLGRWRSAASLRGRLCPDGQRRARTPRGRRGSAVAASGWLRTRSTELGQQSGKVTADHCGDAILA